MTNEIDDFRSISDRLLPHVRFEGRSARNVRITEAVLNGATYSSVARSFDLSVERVRGIAISTLRRSHRRWALGQAFGGDGLAFADLSARAKNILRWLGCNTPDDVAQKWEEIGPLGFLDMPNMGRKTLNEIKDAFGLDEPARPISRYEYDRAKAIVALYEQQEQTGKGETNSGGEKISGAETPVNKGAEQ